MCIILFNLKYRYGWYCNAVKNMIRITLMYLPYSTVYINPLNYIEDFKIINSITIHIKMSEKYKFRTFKLM